VDAVYYAMDGAKACRSTELVDPAKLNVQKVLDWMTM